MISRTLAPAACALAVLVGANSIALGAGSLSDQYKQMGSIAGLAELCYGSRRIPEFINPRIKQLVRTGQLDGDVATVLIAKYHEAYKHAIVEMTVWIGTQQSYGKKPFDCKSGPDVAGIRQMEDIILRGLEEHS
jgi:hypothetical protein